ncbi:unnamed protein product [Symbiodinium sp. CCMP2592]|nr:unnamed protein product [Symbiodinium sp. CCMP2592]
MALTVLKEARDLDDCYMVNRRDSDPIRDGRKQDIRFEAQDFYVTRPLGPSMATQTTVTDMLGEDCPSLCSFLSGNLCHPLSLEKGEQKTNSTKSLAAAAGDGEDETPSARQFLMSTARRSLDEAFTGGKPSDSEKKSGARCLSECTIGGSSSSKSSGDEDSSSCLESEDVDDSAALFGLSRKELQKSDEVCKLDDFPSKQLGFVLSHVTEMLAATEVYECGGELEPRTHCGFAWAKTSVALMNWGRYINFFARFITVAAKETLLANREKRAQKQRQKEEKEQYAFEARVAIWTKCFRRVVRSLTWDGRSDEGKSAMQKKAATQDLKQQISRQSSGSGIAAPKAKKLPPPKPPKRKGETDDSRVGKPKLTTTEPRSNLRAIRDKEPEQHEEKEEPEVPGEGEDVKTGKDDDEFLGEDDVPSPPEELDSDDNDEVANSEGQQESGDDDDIFTGDFALEKASKAEHQKAKAIPAKAQMYLDKLDKDLASCIPKDLSEPPLGPGKAFYNKLSIKAKTELDPWAQRIASGEAAWWQLWSSMLF